MINNNMEAYEKDSELIHKALEEIDRNGRSDTSWVDVAPNVEEKRQEEEEDIDTEIDDEELLTDLPDLDNSLQSRRP